MLTISSISHLKRIQSGEWFSTRMRKKVAILNHNLYFVKLQLFEKIHTSFRMRCESLVKQYLCLLLIQLTCFFIQFIIVFFFISGLFNFASFRSRLSSHFKDAPNLAKKCSVFSHPLSNDCKKFGKDKLINNLGSVHWLFFAKKCSVFLHPLSIGCKKFGKDKKPRQCSFKLTFLRELEESWDSNSQKILFKPLQGSRRWLDLIER
jgi:hypothetical protein